MQITLASSQRPVVAAIVTKKLKALPKKTTSVRPGTVTLKPGTTKKPGTSKVGTAPKPAPPKVSFSEMRSPMPNSCCPCVYCVGIEELLCVCSQRLFQQLEDPAY